MEKFMERFAAASESGDMVWYYTGTGEFGTLDTESYLDTPEAVMFTTDNDRGEVAIPKGEAVTMPTDGVFSFANGVTVVFPDAECVDALPVRIGPIPNVC